MADEAPQTPIGRLLLRLRTEQGLSLYELANRTGINRSTLMRIEDGSTSQPTGQALNRLADALGVDVEDFYDAVWIDAEEPLPSPAVYFRNKYDLDDAQVAELQKAVQRITQRDNKRTKNERRST